MRTVLQVAAVACILTAVIMGAHAILAALTGTPELRDPNVLAPNVLAPHDALPDPIDRDDPDLPYGQAGS